MVSFYIFHFTKRANTQFFNNITCFLASNLNEIPSGYLIGQIKSVGTKNLILGVFLITNFNTNIYIYIYIYI
jgi:hypothetical protein